MSTFTEKLGAACVRDGMELHTDEISGVHRAIFYAGASAALEMLHDELMRGAVSPSVPEEISRFVSQLCVTIQALAAEIKEWR